VGEQLTIQVFQHIELQKKEDIIMKKVFIATFLLCFTFPFVTFADNTTLTPQKIILKPGTSYKIDNINIMCVAEDILSPVAAKECQYYGGYKNDRCIYEKLIFAFEEKKCVEECQHWNARSERCSYATKCRFFPSVQVLSYVGLLEFCLLLRTPNRHADLPLASDYQSYHYADHTILLFVL
jgi:hypothetical protein